MPTKKKRVGFIPRDDVMKIIEKLSLENNLSNSKIISILVEEALSKRGIFNKNTGKVLPSFKKIKDQSFFWTNDLPDFKDNENNLISNNLENHKGSNPTNHFKEPKKEEFDFQTYKKFLSFLKFQEMIDEYDK